MKRWAVYPFLCGVYLLYWNHAEYFADDWILMPLFRKASSGFGDFAVRAIQNRIYEVFRMQWLSILFGYGITWIGGYTAQFNFAVVLLLHLANAWLLCQALGRWGVDRSLAYLAGALFLVLPTSRFVLFTYFTNPFFIFATFWVLLLLRERRWWLAAVLAVAGMFAGEQVFALLALGIPLAAGCFRRPAVRATVAVWGAMGLAGLVYLGWINVQPPGEARRYEWVSLTFWNNVNMIYEGWWNLTGLPPDAPFRVAFTVAGVALAVGAALLVAAMLRRPEGDGGVSLGRVALFGAGGVVLGYAPTLWLAAGYPLRYHYVPTPFLAVLLASGCWALGRRTAPVAGGLLVGFFTLNAVSEMRQCWIPASDRQRALEAEVRRLRGVVEAGDFVAVIGEPFEFGTAQHFSLHSAETAGPFVEWATGVGPVTVARGLVYRPPGLALFLKWNHWRPLTDADLRRTHLLVRSRHGVFEKPEWVAQDTGHGRFRVLPLAGTADLGGATGAALSREQLVLLGRRVYFP